MVTYSSATQVTAKTPRTAQTAMMTATLSRSGGQQRGHAERGQPGRERRPVPVAGDQAGRHQVRGHAGQGQRGWPGSSRARHSLLAALAYSGTVDSSR